MTFLGVTGLIFSIMFQKKGEVLRLNKEKEASVGEKPFKPMNVSTITDESTAKS
jgi:hypothetical protein